MTGEGICPSMRARRREATRSRDNTAVFRVCGLTIKTLAPDSLSVTFCVRPCARNFTDLGALPEFDSKARGRVAISEGIRSAIELCNGAGRHSGRVNTHAAKISRTYLLSI